MKLKKKVKFIILLLVLVVIGVVAYFTYKSFVPANNTKEVKVLSKIEKYGYTLKDTKSKKYKTMFNELKKILDSENINEEDYAKKIAEMFIYDFYSLKDKNAKTDIGGVEFIHPDVLENFLLNAQDTYYKYVENNIYNNRKQKLPEVDKVTISSIEKQSFNYGDKQDTNAYIINANWVYTEEDFQKYQNKATLVLVHDDIKLYLVELQK